MKAGFLLVISGPAGTGKGTVCNRLMERHNNINFSISATTRKPRKGEVHGVDYYFIDEGKFKDMIDRDEFLEHAFVHTNYYGTPKKFVYEEIKNDNLVLLEIDVQGAMQVKKNYPDAISIFLLPPSMEELKTRIVNRGTETEEEINKRMENAYKEIGTMEEYTYYVINDDVDEAVKNIESIVKAERSRVERYPEIKEYYLSGGGIEC